MGTHPSAILSPPNPKTQTVLASLFLQDEDSTSEAAVSQIAQDCEGYLAWRKSNPSKKTSYAYLLFFGLFLKADEFGHRRSLVDFLFFLFSNFVHYSQSNED